MHPLYAYYLPVNASTLSEFVIIIDRKWADFRYEGTNFSRFSAKINGRNSNFVQLPSTFENRENGLVDAKEQSLEASYENTTFASCKLL